MEWNVDVLLHTYTRKIHKQPHPRKCQLQRSVGYGLAPLARLGAAAPQRLDTGQRVCHRVTGRGTEKGGEGSIRPMTGLSGLQGLPQVPKYLQLTKQLMPWSSGLTLWQYYFS